MAFDILLPLLCLLILPPISVTAAGNVSVGASLTAGDPNSSPWLSPSEDFAFGFSPLEDQKDQFLLSIWYNKIPDKTIVWYANGGIPARKGSKLTLTSDSGLVLTSPDGQEFWKQDTLLRGVANGFMNNTGNFELQDSQFSKVWESFKDARDTLLPSQVIERGGSLSSRLFERNFSRGRFQLRLKISGDLVLYSLNLPTNYPNENYYESDTTGESNGSSPGLRLMFNESGYLYILTENDQKVGLSSGERSSAADSYYRATINFDGVFTVYRHPKTASDNGSWIAIWSIPDNICLASLASSGSGVCGYNSICTLNSAKRPICQCPRGYSSMDSKNQYGSCKPDFIQGCKEDELSYSKDGLYEYEVLTNTDWPLSDYVLLRPYTEEACKKSCMEDCMCAVAIFRLGDSCWKKKLPLSNGRVDPSLNEAKAFIKVRKDMEIPFLNPTKRESNEGTIMVVGSVLLGGSAFLNLLLICAIFVGCAFIYKRKGEKVHRTDDVKINLKCFTYKELVDATNGFKEELGRGAFGIVYKGFINMGSCSSIPVAVKKLNTFFQDSEKEFRTEVNVIGQTHHKHLVRLVGFCEEGPERLLVYEFMSNGTLASFIFGDLKPSWDQRIKAVYGVARGLLYLHEECTTQIIHCDIKPQNILLDDYYTARISDFGMAKLLMMNQSQTHTAIRGTKGYLAPEWFRNLPITTKVDVYSFGVVLLEIICCRRSVDAEVEQEERAILTDWAYDSYKEGTLDALVGHDEEALEDRKKLERLVMVAMWCIQEDPSLRPTMRRVTQMIEGVLEVLVPPCPFPYNASYSQ